MRRRPYLAILASVPVLGGCLSTDSDGGPREFSVGELSVESVPASLEFDVREPLDDDGRPTANSINPERDGRLVFELSNPTDESMTLEAPAPALFGVLEASDADHRFPLWQERYEETTGVELDDGEPTATGDPEPIELESGESVARPYELRYSALVDELPVGVDGTFETGGELRANAADKPLSWDVAFRLYETEQYDG